MNRPNIITRSDTDVPAPQDRDFAYEAELIAEARAQAAARLTVSEEQVDAWIDSLGTDHELPLPREVTPDTGHNTTPPQATS